MRRREKEITDKTELEAVLHDGGICRIGMIDGKVPYLVPMNYGYADGKIYLHSALAGRKVDVLRKNNYVCFEIENGTEIVENEEACSWGMRYKTIIGYGNILELEDPAEKRGGLALIMKKYSDKKDWDFPDQALNKVLVLRLDIESMTGKKSGQA